MPATLPGKYVVDPPPTLTIEFSDTAYRVPVIALPDHVHPTLWRVEPKLELAKVVKAEATVTANGIDENTTRPPVAAEANVHKGPPILHVFAVYAATQPKVIACIPVPSFVAFPPKLIPENMMADPFAALSCAEAGAYKWNADT